MPSALDSLGGPLVGLLLGAASLLAAGLLPWLLWRGLAEARRGREARPRAAIAFVALGSATGLIVASSLGFDAEALTGGELNVVEGAGVFPEGMHVSFPGLDMPPAPRKIDAAYPAGAPSLGVYLAVPRNQPGELLCRTDPSSEALTPYAKGQARVKDDADTGQEREIPVARKRLRILFTSEPREAYSCLPIAVIRRTAAGGFELEDQFIPSCQYASASPRLMALVRRVLEIMVKKGEELSKQRRHRGDGSLDPNATESAGFLFLHTLNQFIPRIRTLFQHPRQHPIPPGPSPSAVSRCPVPHL